MEQHGHVRDPLPAPERFPPFPGSLLGSSGQQLPSDLCSVYQAAGAEGPLDALAHLTGIGAGQLLDGDARRTAFPLHGGEMQGLQRLRYYLQGTVSSSDVGGAQAGHAEPPRAASTADNAQEAGGDEVPHDVDSSFGEAARHAGAPAQEHASCSGRLADAAPGVLAAPVHSFKDTRMGAVGVDNSLKLSAYLAAGCLSPREVHAAIVRAREKHGEDTGHSWLIMHLTIRSIGCFLRSSLGTYMTYVSHALELALFRGSAGTRMDGVLLRLLLMIAYQVWTPTICLRRDFFLFTALKDGPRLEGLPSSCTPASEPDQNATAMFRRWAAGRTGFPFVDACMRELAATGYISNRGRQNVSSFLCKVRPVPVCASWPDPCACNPGPSSAGPLCKGALQHTACAASSVDATQRPDSSWGAMQLQPCSNNKVKPK